MEKNADNEVDDISSDKLNKRLTLLRDEYVKLQKKYFNLQNRYDQLMVMSNGHQPMINNNSTTTLKSNDPSTDSDANGSISFVEKICHFVASLYNNKLYSDIVIEYDNGEHSIHAHKFVLLFRSQKWSDIDLANVDRLCFAKMSHSIADALFKWVYTAHIQWPTWLEKSSQYEFIIELVQYGCQFDLKALVEQCEEWLMSYIKFDNCVYIYQSSEQLGLTRLSEYAAKVVALNWDSLQEKDFEKVSTTFLHRLFKEKSLYPLHKAIQIRNEDLIFLLLMDFDDQTFSKVNQFDNQSNLPLDLALRSAQFSIGRTLIEHGANINAVDSDQWPLAHRYVKENIWPAAKFLIEQGVSVNDINPDGDSMLHLCADCVSSSQTDSMIELVKMLLQRKPDLNIQNKVGHTALHRSIIRKNVPFFTLLTSDDHSNKVNWSLRSSWTNDRCESALSLALDVLENDSDDYFASKLLSFNVDVDTVNPITGDSLLIQCARQQFQKACIFLVEKAEANFNLVNHRGESILHIAASKGLKELVSILLGRNVNCNQLTMPPGDGVDDGGVFRQTPLHLAILAGQHDIIKEIIQFHDRASRKGCLDSALLTPDLDVKNSKGESALWLAIQMGQLSIGEMLIAAGADVNVKDENGHTLLHRAIVEENDDAAEFVLRHGIRLDELCPSTGKNYVQYAIDYGRVSILEQLCELGAHFNESSTSNDCCLLWQAFEQCKKSGQMQIASIMIRYNVDLDGWHQHKDDGLGAYMQTLLHRALDENNQDAAILLIDSGCDIHCVRRPGPNGEGKQDCDGQSPLHMACAWGMERVVECLLKHNVNANLCDNEGKTALHLAIINQNHTITDMLLKHPATDPYKTDNYGNSPFALAIRFKSRQTAQALLARDRSISEQPDGKGRNYLHLALQRNDYDALLFLLDNRVNVNTTIKDSVQKAPIHLAAETGSEIILRTLVLAGSQLNVMTSHNQTALHLAAELDKYQIVEILLELGIDATIEDNNGNTALHLAASKAQKNTCRVLIQHKPSIDLGTTNNRGQNILHCLASSPYKSSAISIFDELLSIRSDQFDLDSQDNDGNTALLLAYMNGNGNLCRSLVKQGACLGLRNNQAVSIFNHVMPTRQLLTSLLDSLSRMPAWRDGPECLECGQKFNITNRRHHCRHCGRELCSRCSSKEIVIMKFQMDKKSIQSRVCQLCYDVLTLGIFN